MFEFDSRTRFAQTFFEPMEFKRKKNTKKQAAVNRRWHPAAVSDAGGPSDSVGTDTSSAETAMTDASMANASGEPYAA